MTSTQPHEKYRPAGVRHYNMIPAHWKMCRLQWLTLPRSDLNSELTQTNLLSLSYGRIVQKPIDTRDGLLPASFETYNIVQPGDVVFRLTDLQNDHRSLRTGLVKELGIITSAYTTVAPNKINPRFLAYVVRDLDLRKVFYSFGGGLRQSMGYDDLKLVVLPVPPKSEQRDIADFLDYETGEIDAFIADQERLIDLLTERMAAETERAIWLAHDSPRVRIKRCAELLTGFPFRSEDFVTPNEENIRLLRGINVGVGCITWDHEVAIQRDIVLALSAYKLRVGDLLLGLDRPIISRGTRATLVDDQSAGALLVQRVARLRARTHMTTNEWLFNAFSSRPFADYLAPIFTGVSVPHLSPEQVGRFEIPLPDLAVQQRIVRHLRAESAVMRSAITDAREAIALSRERRAALISAAVTGQIDVRDWKRPTTAR